MVSIREVTSVYVGSSNCAEEPGVRLSPWLSFGGRTDQADDPFGTAKNLSHITKGSLTPRP